MQNNEFDYSSPKVIISILKQLIRFRLLYFLLFLASFLWPIYNVLLAELQRRMINAATSGNMTALRNAFILGIALPIVGGASGIVTSYFKVKLDNKSVTELQSDLLRKLMKVKMTVFNQYHTADIVSRICDSAANAQIGINSRVSELISNFLIPCFLLSYLFSINFSLTIGILVIAIVFPLLLIPFSNSLRKNYDHKQEEQADSNSIVQESIHGAEIIRSLSLTSKFIKMFKDKNNIILKYSKRIAVTETLILRVNQLVTMLGVVFILGYGGFLVYDRKLNIGDVIAFLVSFESVAQLVVAWMKIWPELQKNISTANRAYEIFDFSEEIVSGEKASILQNKLSNEENIRVSFEKVYLSIDNTEILKDITFSAETGKVTALVGESGSGKSTILKLLLRFYEHNEGQILCNGIPIGSVGLEGWRDMVGYVSQDPILFSDTIYENIRYGCKTASQDEIIEAAKAANIHDFIMSMPLGYQTKLTDRGTNLSGGERQRISIARAILKNPKVLLLDEPTSALDSENEDHVQKTINTLISGRTTIVVAHRLKTICNADKIVFIEDGCVQEEGTHSTLLNLKKKYFSFYGKK